MILKLLKAFLLVCLCAVSVADIYFRATASLYRGDEIFNLDTIITFDVGNDLGGKIG